MTIRRTVHLCLLFYRRATSGILGSPHTNNHIPPARRSGMPIRLVKPTDFLVLEALSDGKRDVAPNLATRTGQDRGYINSRLRRLFEKGLLTRVGPNDHSGLYRITPLGVAAFHERDTYEQSPDVFENIIDELAAEIEIRHTCVETPW